MQSFSGVMHIGITPFTRDERVDAASLSRTVERAVEAGVNGIVPLGIMGEAHKLSDRERDEVLETVVEGAAGRIAVVAGITSESSAVAAQRARRAAELGATQVMLAPPRNVDVGDALLQHYARVADAGVPLVIQDEPVTTGVRMPGRFFADLAAIPGVVAAKVEESPSPAKITAIRGSAPQLVCFGGLGGVSFFEELDRGAAGIMTGFAFPELLVAIHRAFASGDREGARSVFYRYLPLIRYEAQLGVGGVSIRKALFHERGIIETPIVRMPATPVDAVTLAELRETVAAMGLSL